MKHVYVESDDKLYSFAPENLIINNSPNIQNGMFEKSGIVTCVQRNPVFYAGIALTNLCNLCCKHCSVPTTKSHLSNYEISLEMIRALVENLVKQGLARVSVTGGEPFLYPHLNDFFKLLDQNNIESKINTNGTHLNYEIINDLITLGLSEIDVSINKLIDDSQTYFDNRDHSSSRIRSLEMLVKHFKGKLVITASSVLTKHVTNNLFDIERNLADIGVDRWRLRELMPSQMNNSQAPDEVFPIPAVLVERMVGFVNSEHPFEIFGYLYESIQKKEISKRCSNLEKNYLYIAPTHEVFWMAGLVNAKLGVFSGNNMQELANKLAETFGEMTIPKRCIECPARYICLISPYAYNDISKLANRITVNFS